MPRVPVGFGSCQKWALAAVFLAAMVAGRTAQARPEGVASTLFGASANGCNECHGGGTAPTVTLTANDLTLTSGQQITLTFTVTTVNGNPGAAGFNIRSSQQGVFAVGGSSSAMTQVLTGTNGWSEATHNAPKAGEPATFTTLWTPSAATSGDVTFTAWGNAVNRANGNQGDRASSTTLVVNVVCPQSVFYRDADGDGFGNPSSTMLACAAPTGFVANNTDCNDTNPAIHPGAAEVCNGVDDNCAGGVDEAAVDRTTFYRDSDGDGFGAAASGTMLACTQPTGYVASNTDCNDNSPAVHPGATEMCNGVDDNCTGGTDENGVCDAGVDTSGAVGAGDAADAVVPQDTGVDSGPVVDSGSGGADASGADAGTGGNDGSPSDSRADGSGDSADGGVDVVEAGGPVDTGVRDVVGSDVAVGSDATVPDVRADATAVDAPAADNRPSGTDARADAVAADGGGTGGGGYTGPVPSGHGGGCGCRYGASDPSTSVELAASLLGLILVARRRRGRRR